MILNKFHVFLTFNGLNEKSFGQILYEKKSRKNLETIIILSFQKYFKLRIKLLFLNFEVTCYKTGFKNCILRICNIYINSKSFLQSKHITGLKKLCGIFVVHNVVKF